MNTPIFVITAKEKFYLKKFTAKQTIVCKLNLKPLPPLPITFKVSNLADEVGIHFDLPFYLPVTAVRRSPKPLIFFFFPDLHSLPID